MHLTVFMNNINISVASWLLTELDIETRNIEENIKKQTGK
jgi:hypothetical protein